MKQTEVDGISDLCTPTQETRIAFLTPMFLEKEYSASSIIRISIIRISIIVISIICISIIRISTIRISIMRISIILITISRPSTIRFVESCPISHVPSMKMLQNCFTCHCNKPKATLADTSTLVSLREFVSEGRAAARKQMSYASWLIK